MHNWQEREQNSLNELVKIISLFHERGLSPATSTNYSIRTSLNKNHYVISQSGIDKSEFKLQNFMLIDQSGEPVENPNLKSSAETYIHTVIYEVFHDTNAILHTHSLPATYLSMKTNDNQLSFEGLELLKGLEGNLTHELTEIIPIFPNSQDIKALSLVIKDYLISNPKVHGIILKGHGLYTWGKDLKSAKRHVETFEYLFNYKLMEYGHGHSTLSTK
jgi:methylthioribulose-1-phosphate dehydratase